MQNSGKPHLMSAPTRGNWLGVLNLGSPAKKEKP